MIRQPVIEAIWDSPGGSYMHGSTFGGHPVATAVAVANMQALSSSGALANVLANEAYLGVGLDRLMASHRCVKDVRGTGYFYALELMADRDTGTELSDDQNTVLRGGILSGFCRKARLLIRPDDRGATMLLVSPPLIADADVLDDLLTRLGQILEMTDRWLAVNR
jgi:adenosylmethionine-8-amino-7-oxononanoate aminotransferase